MENKKLNAEDGGGWKTPKGREMIKRQNKKHSKTV